jgi:hypothetical protein
VETSHVTDAFPLARRLTKERAIVELVVKAGGTTKYENTRKGEKCDVFVECGDMSLLSSNAGMSAQSKICGN